MNNLSKKENNLIPNNCPSCNTKLKEKGVHLHCDNPKCEEQAIQRIIYWVKKCEMDGVSDSTVKLLYNNGYIGNIKGLYNLQYDKISELDGMGEKKIKNLKKQVDKTKKMNIQDFVSRIGIELVGNKAMKKLNINTLEEFLEFNDPTYVIGQNLIDYREENLNFIKEVLEAITIVDIKQNKNSKGNVCMTGKGTKGRKEYIKEIEEKGYEFVSSISKETNILICEDANGTSSKLKKATKLGIKLVSYTDFFN